ncbi:MAG: hypothetical protein ACKOCT_21595 [Alphaproteobacteria bacterium]
MNHSRYGATLAAVAALAGILLGGAGAAQAQRQSGIQLSPDSNRYFISKDVGQERWAITYNLDDKTVTGNVFPLDGGAPTFLSCAITRVEQAPNPADAQYFMDCRAAGPCASAPCKDQWGAPSAVGPIPGSFLLPTNTLATYAGNVQPIYNASCATSAVCHGKGASFVVLARDVSYSNTFLVEADGVNGPQGFYIDPFSTDGSYLFQKLLGTGAGERMPYNSNPLPPDQIDQIRNWILEGAADN